MPNRAPLRVIAGLSFVFLCLVGPLPAGAEEAARPHVESSSPQQIEGLFLGYAVRRGREWVEPLFGIPGAAYASNRISLGGPLADMTVSSERGYALAIRSDSGRVLAHRLDRDTGLGVGVRLDNVSAGGDRVALSPSGSAALVYHRTGRWAEIVRGLPFSAASVRRLELPDAPGVLTALAVSDDARIVVSAFSTRAQSRVFAQDADGVPRLVATGRQFVDLAFLPRRQAALLTDAATPAVLLVDDVLNAAGLRELIAGRDGLRRPRFARAAADGRSIIVADGESRVAVVALERGSPRFVECGCRISILRRLNDGYFQLSDHDGAIAVADATPESPAVFLAAPTAQGVPAPRRQPRAGRAR